MVKGQILFKNGDQYNGELQNGKMAGHGIYKFKNGSLYEGQFLQNQFHGRGKLIDKLNDLVIVGEFKNGTPDGYSRVVYADGSQYEGLLVRGLRQGKGVYKYAKSQSLQKYEGLFEEDSYSGFGQLIFKDKKKYKGEFKSNLFHGQGEYATSQYTYVGNFCQGRIEGRGIMKYSNNEYYEGQFQLNKRNGIGKFKYEDGSEYSGRWKDDMRHGKGKLKKPNGDIFQAQFQRNQCIGQILIKTEKYEIIAQMSNEKLDGPIKMIGPDVQIQASYKEGVKHGRVVIEKQNKYGEKVSYNGQFIQGKQNPYTVSYSNRF